jgi:hypothetical protein
LLRVTGSATAVLPHLRQRATDEKIDAVSHLARRWSRAKGIYLNVSVDDANRWFQEAELATPSEQARNLIVWIGSHRDDGCDPAMEVTISTPELASIVGGRNKDTSMQYLIQHCIAKRWVEDRDETHERHQVGLFILRLTFDGWMHFEDLMRVKVESRSAFMAMAFSDQRLNQVYAECFVPAVGDAGFKLRRLDEGQGAGLIDDQLRVAVRTSKFLVVDLSTGNRGAYWEAGFAEGLGKPVIYVCEEAVLNHDDHSQRPHFDTNHLVTVKWSIDHLEQARFNLTATVRNTFPTEATMPPA